MATLLRRALSAAPVRRGRVVVVGGGASGYFAAIFAARQGADVEVLESAALGLRKVLASGGGRCNVMHGDMEVRDLIDCYPRGRNELRGALTKRWGQAETRDFFEDLGVQLKTESDGRVFPATDDAETIVAALRRAAEDAGVSVRFGAPVSSVKAVAAAGFRVETRARGSTETEATECDAVVIATGSAPFGYQLAQSFDHAVTAPYPSLFSFRIPNSPLFDLAGISLEDAMLTLELAVSGEQPKKRKDDPALSQRAPMLVTHRGVTGPAALRLSAFAAAELKVAKYKGTLVLNVVPGVGNVADVAAALRDYKDAHAGTQVVTAAGKRPFEVLPKRLWAALVAAAGVEADKKWADVKKTEVQAIAVACAALRLNFEGKDANKDEFVTAGGVALAGVDSRRFESKLVPGLHFCGEVIDIDGVTGGHNFQHCWTSGYIAGVSAADRAAQR